MSQEESVADKRVKGDREQNKERKVERNKVRYLLLTSSEHQAHVGLTARHCWQELTPRVAQMLGPATERQRF